MELNIFDAALFCIATPKISAYQSSFRYPVFISNALLPNFDLELTSGYNYINMAAEDKAIRPFLAL